MDPKRIVREGYDRIGAAYRPWSDARGDEVRRWFLAQIVARVPPAAHVLELGCGTGEDAVVLAEGRRYVGVDISAVMLSFARARLASGTFIQADLTAVEFAEASFDAVVSLYVFGHVPSTEHVPTLARAFRWLRPGGVLCCSFPSGSDDDVEEDFIGVPMFFGGIGQAATEAALRDLGSVLELVERRDRSEADGSTESFVWVVAAKP